MQKKLFDRAPVPHSHQPAVWKALVYRNPSQEIVTEMVFRDRNRDRDRDRGRERERDQEVGGLGWSQVDAGWHLQYGMCSVDGWELSPLCADVRTAGHSHGVGLPAGWPAWVCLGALGPRRRRALVRSACVISCVSVHGCECGHTWQQACLGTRV